MEVLVADNDSHDHTEEILNSFKDGRLRFWRNERNLGAEKSVMNLLKAARGKWVVCLTDDDYLLPNALESLLKVIESDPELGVILSSVNVVNEFGNHLYKYEFYPKTTKFSAGMEALYHLCWAAHIFSRITVRRQWLDLSGTERHLDSMYPQMYFVGTLLKDHPGFYLGEPLVTHTVGNKVFWEYPKDYMVAARIRMINDMLSGPRWEKERKLLLDQLIEQIAKYNMPLWWKKSAIAWVFSQIQILRNKEIAFSYCYWKSLPIFLIGRLKKSLKTNRVKTKHMIRKLMNAI